MSELKAFTFTLGRYTEDGYPCVVAVDDEDNPRLAYDEKFYLKSEADRYIGELKDDIEYWKAAARKNMDDNVAMAKQRADAFKRECHQKFKRCLAMARWCGAEVYHIRRTPLCDMSEHEYWQYENDFWQRWQKRWMNLLCR